jgi:hypothetical protein
MVLHPSCSNLNSRLLIFGNFYFEESRSCVGHGKIGFGNKEIVGLRYNYMDCGSLRDCGSAIGSELYKMNYYFI